MLIKILGAIDLIAGIILVFGIQNFFPEEIILSLGVLLIGKSSLGMLRDFGSWIDIIAGGIFLISGLISFPWIIEIIAGIFVLQKGIFSFF